MGMQEIAFLWVYVSWAVANTMIAEEKGRSALAALILSVIVTPIVVWLYLVAVPANARVAKKSGSVAVSSTLAPSVDRDA